jgi:hypothetical protein
MQQKNPNWVSLSMEWKWVQGSGNLIFSGGLHSEKGNFLKIPGFSFALKNFPFESDIDLMIPRKQPGVSKNQITRRNSTNLRIGFPSVFQKSRTMRSIYKHPSKN